jgi:uncharacterized protein
MDVFIGPLIGGVLIGLGSVVLMLFSGHIAGISGIVGGIFSRPFGDRLGWRIAFIGGLVLGPVLLAQLAGRSSSMPSDQSLGVLALAGLIVGIGTMIGSGCTSGHGVCGISRLSMRSLLATFTFIAVAALTVFILKHLV